MKRKAISKEKNTILIKGHPVYGSSAFLNKEAKLQVKELPLEALKAELDRMMGYLSQCLTNAAKIGEYELSEVSFQAEISTSGQVILLGFGGQAGAKAAVTFKFAKPAK